MKKFIKIKQIWGVEYEGKKHLMCLTENGKLLKYIEDMKTGKSEWIFVDVPLIK